MCWDIFGGCLFQCYRVGSHSPATSQARILSLTWSMWRRFWALSMWRWSKRPKSWKVQAAGERNHKTKVYETSGEAESFTLSLKGKFAQNVNSVSVYSPWCWRERRLRFLSSAKHLCSFSAKHCCSVLLCKRSQWGLVSKRKKNKPKTHANLFCTAHPAYFKSADALRSQIDLKRPHLTPLKRKSSL